MKKQALFFLIIFLFSNWSDKNYNDKDIIELPIEIVKGYGPFELYSHSIDWRTNEPGSEWSKTEEIVKGIPKDWHELVVKRIWFDLQQFVYQNYKQGIMNEEYFNALVHSWNMDLENDNYSSVPIKCYTHIALGKDDHGDIIYKLDTDNDKDLADEELYYPFGPVDWDDLDSLSQYSHRITAEIIRNDQVTEIKIPLLIWLNKRGDVNRNFPFYAKAFFNDIELNVSSSFCHTAFYKESILCINPTEGQKAKHFIQLNQAIELDGKRYENLGIDINKGVLRLGKIKIDKKYYSNQVGTYAKDFSGNDFLTNKSKSLKGYAGKYLLLDFWGTWCKPCLNELPNLKHAYIKMDREKIDFISIVHDRPEVLKKFLQKDSIPWPQIISTNENNIVDIYGVLGFPTTFLIDPAGKIVAKDIRGEHLIDSLNYYIK